MSELKCPEELEHLPPDTVAECYSLPEKTYLNLWSRCVDNMAEDQDKDENIQSVGHMETPDQQYDFGLPRYWDL